MEAALDGVAEAGARHVEPAFIRGYVPFTEDDLEDGPARAMRRALEDRGLLAGALSAHLDLSAPDAARALRRRIRFAALIGAPFVVTNAGPAAAEDAIRRTLDAALGEEGATVLLENPGHGAGDLVPDAAAGAALLERIDADPARLGLNLDLGNVHTYGRGAVPLPGQVAAAGRWLRHLHLKDVRDTGTGWRFTAVGAGDLPHADLLGEVPAQVSLGLELPLRLRRVGYADPSRAEAPVPLAQIAEAVRASLATVGR
jgi:sugar phosphate isomerase/epimerase